MQRSLRFLAACAVTFVCSFETRAADGGLTPEHVAKTRIVSQVAMSPDGAHVAYLLSVPRKPFEEADGNNWVELHVVDRQGNDRGFITGQVSIGAIEWTADGSAITFLAKRGDDKGKSVYAIPLAGGEARRIIAHETDIASYSFSADGKTVAFLAQEKEDEAWKKLKEQGFNQEVFEEQPRFTKVFVTSPESTEKAREIPVVGQPSELRMAPDGTRIALALAPTPTVDDNYMNRAVHVLDVASGAVVTRFPNRGKLGAIAWSPDSTALAIISAEDRNDPQEGRIYLAPAAGGDWKDLLPNHEGHVTTARWNSPNLLTLLVDEGVTTAVTIVSRGGEVRELMASGDYVLTGLSLAGNGRQGAAIRSSPSHPPEVYAMGRGDAAPKRLTDSNPWLKDVRLAKQEVVTFKARDGLELQGILIRPLDEVAGQRYPLLLTVHGGPESHDANGWLTRYAGPGQMGAAKGYAVFYPNYRGSTGRGVAFSKLGQGDYAGKEFDDLVDAVDHIVNMGLVDTKKVGVTGGSYGGYASAWCATKLTDRFAAAVMFVGISNNVSKNGTTDIPQEMELVHARMGVAENIDFLMERSPVSYVKQARTPILIMGGKDDPRVHPTQSMELYRQLKTLGQVPVRLVYFPGEGHGNQRAASKYDYSLRMLQWFDHYLKGPGGAPPAWQLEYPLNVKKS
ncbi:MAG: S9 family peptidase [Planctomycetes bacterium]|nr:S9 family peptidase [Planctomycetota bacterium]